MHASFVVVFGDSVLHVFVFAHLQEFLHLLRQLVGREALVGFLKVGSV